MPSTSTLAGAPTQPMHPVGAAHRYGDDAQHTSEPAHSRWGAVLMSCRCSGGRRRRLLRRHPGHSPPQLVGPAGVMAPHLVHQEGLPHGRVPAGASSCQGHLLCEGRNHHRRRRRQPKCFLTAACPAGGAGLHSRRLLPVELAGRTADLPALAALDRTRPVDAREIFWALAAPARCCLPFSAQNQPSGLQVSCVTLCCQSPGAAQN